MTDLEAAPVPRRRRRLRLWLLPMIALLVIGAVVGYAFACSKRLAYMGFSVPPTVARHAKMMSLEQARTTSSFSLAELPAISFKQCEGTEEAITLIQIVGKPHEVLMTYSHGLWLRQARAPRGLPLGMHVFDRETRAGTVRGFDADLTNPGRAPKYFFCDDGFTCAGFDVVAGAARWYPHGGEIHWIENGVDYHLQGPYEVDVLIALAEQLRFLEG